MYDEANRETTGTFLTSILNGIGESICANQPLRFRAIGEMVKDKLSKKAFDMIQKHIQMPKDPAQVAKTILCLNHGDFWSNNMLFKYDKNNQPIDCCLVDFQVK